jgi:hypothetical protein
MFRTIASRIQRDNDYPERHFTLDVYGRVLEGAFYDHLPYGFHIEQNGAGEYVPLRDRRPNVRYNLCRLVVDDAVSLLFSEGHFPTPDLGDAEDAAKQAVLDLIKGSKLNDLLLEGATIGAAGSVAFQMRVLKQSDNTTNLIFFSAHATGFLTPTFDPANPDKLLKITERYKVRGDALKAAGYAIEPKLLRSLFWFQREWDDTSETWFVPLLRTDALKGLLPQIDNGPNKTLAHGLGYCPWVWVKNLPGKLKLIATDRDPALAWSDVDGACTFEGAISAMIEIEYQLSQAGRGLKYNMDPWLLLKEPAAPVAGQPFVKQPTTSLIVGEKGDAKLMELEGSAFEVVLEYVRALRELGLENVHGNRADSQKLAGAQSGRAMELMNQALIWLADRLRVSYGEGALRSLLTMAIKAHAKYPITVGADVLPAINPATPITLIWPAWYAPTAADRTANATALNTLKTAGLMSTETGVKSIASDYDIEDIPAEVAAIRADKEWEATLVPPGPNSLRDTL